MRFLREKSIVSGVTYATIIGYFKVGYDSDFSGHFVCGLDDNGFKSVTTKPTL